MRSRYDVLSVLKTLGEETASTTGQPKQFGGLPEGAVVALRITSASGGDAQLTVYIEASNDGDNWDEIARFDSLTSPTLTYRTVGGAPFRYYRYRSNIEGTSPAFTYEVFFAV